MDDLESRLTDELRSAGAAVDASTTLDRAVRARVRRRQTVAGALGVLPVALLAVGALWVLDTSDDAADVDTFRPTPTSVVEPPPTDPPAVPIDDLTTPPESTDETATDPGDVVATVIPGEDVLIDLPDPGTLGDGPLHAELRRPDTGSATGYSWARLGASIIRENGVLAIRGPAPHVFARSTGSEFSPIELVPLPAGEYRLFVDDTDVGSIAVGDDGTPSAAEAPEIAAESVILRADGIADVPFGTGVDETVARLRDRFGTPVVTSVEFACVATAYADFANGLVLEFRGEEGFQAWYYGYELHADGYPTYPFPAPMDVSITTENGIGIGTLFDEVLAVGGGASGGYDGRGNDVTGGGIWFENDQIAGRLSDDPTRAGTVVRTITGGATRAPARQVC